MTGVEAVVVEVQDMALFKSTLVNFICLQVCAVFRRPQWGDACFCHIISDLG
jgi:hypothetical protein